MWVIRDKDTKALVKPGDGRAVMVYLKREKASLALDQHKSGLRGSRTTKAQFEIVPVKLSLDKARLEEECKSAV